MRKTWTFQNNCNKGELSPLLDMRKDTDLYYNGLSSGLNVLGLPQGGVIKRPGMEKIYTLPGFGKAFNFSFNTEQNYLLVFTELRMYVFKDNVYQTDIATPYSATSIREFDYIQSADTAIITHENIEPRAITRTGHTSWSISTISISNTPQYDFSDGASPTPVADQQQITFTNATEGDTYKLTLDGIQTDDIVYSVDSTTNINVIEKELLRLANTGDDANGITVSLNVGTTYDIAFDGDSAYPYDDLLGSGILTQLTNFIITNDAHIQGTSRAEDTWSAQRGWPKTCTFHGGRLWFGGSKERPTTIWGSKVGFPFNFDSGKARDDESIEASLESAQLNAITSIFSNRFLQVFTTGGEFFCPESVITPENRSFPPQTSIGSKRVRPITIDGTTLFIQREGKSINQFVYVDDYKANDSDSISYIAEHLIKDAIQMSVRIGTSSEDANYVFINNADGTKTVFNSLSSEDVAGFTPWKTAQDSSGESVIQSSAVVDSSIYDTIRRTVNGSWVYTVEVETSDCYLDSCVVETGASNTITDLDHLEGETVQAVADGAYMGEFVVVSGQITLPRASVATRSAGLFYAPDVKTMPLNFQMEKGPAAYKKKRFTSIYVSVFESNGIVVNGQRIHDKTIGENQFDAPIPFTGIKRRRPLGWSVEAICHVTQTTPMPFLLRGIGMEVTI